MRYSALVLSALVLSAGVCAAQTGFSTKTYPAVLPATSDNTMLLSADFNNDGRPDLLSYGSRYGYNGTRVPPGNIFLNNGSGGFLAPAPLAGALPMEYAQVGDVNGDGYPDIVGCANTGSDQKGFSLLVYLNKGDGTFNYFAQSYLNGQCRGLTLGDVYQTGHLDAVLAGSLTNANGTITNQLNVFKNDGRGNFTIQPTQNPVLDDPQKSNSFVNCGVIDLVGGDFQQNGTFGLILTTQCLPMGQNNPGNLGTTFFAPESSTPNNNAPYSTFNLLNSAYETYVNGKVADINGDGRPDVVYSGVAGGNYGSDLIYVQNRGNGSFAFTSLFNGLLGANYTGGATAADFNGDGIKDIATTYDNTYSPPIPTLSILAGTKSGGFTDSQDFSTGVGTDSSGDVVAADFNGDGKPDLATLVYDMNTRTTSLKVYTNTQSGSSNPCSTPATANTSKICSPSSGATLSSPLTVNAAANVTGFTANRLYLDNKDVYDSYSQTINTPLNVANGNHTLVLVSYNNKGQVFTSSSNFTVGSGTGNGCSASAPGVNICSPTTGSTDTPPLTITAGAMAQSGYITAIRVYVDNKVAFTVNNPSASKTFSISQGGQDFGGGTHHMTVVAYESTGGAVTGSNYFSELSGPCTTVTPGTQIRICSPYPNGPLNSPVTVNAGASAGSGSITGIRAYIDNNPVAFYSNPKQSPVFYINQPLAIPSGTHYFVLVAYTSTGRVTSAAEYLNIK